MNHICIGVADNCKNPESYGTICVKCNQCGRFKQTNADRIRAMSDEELAEFLILSPEMEFELCRYCINGNTAPDDRGQCLRPNGHCYANDRCEAFKKWLKREATT